MNILQTAQGLQQDVQNTVQKVVQFVDHAAQTGKAIHEVEDGIFQYLLVLGQQYLNLFLATVGKGDMGPTMAHDQGVWNRLPETHARRYVSIFGVFDLERFVYGTREGQKIEFVPLDNRLQLPENAYSYLLQDWSQGLCVESAFGQVSSTLQKIFNVTISVDGLERINTHMAQAAPIYREDRPKPVPESEGEIQVATADGKGVVMRRSAEDPAPPAHRSKGEKASQKRMAMVASVYSVDRYVRTAEEVVAALFRDPRVGKEEAAKRPEPKNKRVMASLAGVDEKAVPVSAIDIVHDWMCNELVERNREVGQWQRPMVYLYDGQESLWDACEEKLPAQGTGILDLLHVTPRLWQAAHVFHKEGSEEAEAFVRTRCLRVLQGRAEGVIRGFREMATKQGLSGAKKKTLTTVCNYLKKNLACMRYDEYLAAGYPIASGVIEGACRHLVKDRMERAGMHWTPRGAQSMLDVRAIHVEGEWKAFQRHRIDLETRKLYPHRELVEGSLFAMAA